MGLLSLTNKWLKDVAQAALYTPAGLYEIGKGTYHDIAGVTHGDVDFSNTRSTAEQVAQGIAQDFRHPIRNAPFLALDVLGAASLGAGAAVRGAAAAAKVGEGARAAEVARALLRNPPPGERILHLTAKNKPVELGDTFKQYVDPVTHKLIDPVEADLRMQPTAVRGFYSKAPAVRGIQKLRDISQEAAPEKSGLTFRLGDHFGPLAGHELRIPSVVRSREHLAKHYTDEASRILKRLEQADGTAKASSELRSPAGEISDAINQATTTGILYLKGSYALPNIAGQSFLTLTQHHFNPIELWKSARMSWKLKGGDPTFTGALGRHVGPEGELADVHQGIRAIMGDTIQEAIHVGETHRYRVTKAISDVHGNLGKLYSKILDSPFRDASFFYEARQAGFHTTEQVRDLVTNPAKRDDLVEVARRANRALIDYTRLGTTERKIVRRVVFFYPWTKGATMYAGHFLREHPIQATATAGIGRMGQETALKELGPVPSFLSGVFKTGERKIPGLGTVPLVSNPSSAAILSTPAQVLEAGRGFALGQTSQFGQLSEFLNPVATAVGESIFRTDPFTGERISAKEGIVDILKGPGSLLSPETFPLGRMLHRGLGLPLPNTRPNVTAEQSKDFLYPSSKGDERKRFLYGVLAGRPLNPAQARSKYRAEQRDLLTSQQRTVESHRFYRTELAKASGGNLPVEVRDALNLRARRYVALANAKDKAGHQLSAEERLSSDLGVLVSMGVLTARQATEMKQTYHGQPEPVIDGIRSRLGAYFGQPVISGFTRTLVAQGKTVPTLPKG